MVQRSRCCPSGPQYLGKRKLPHHRLDRDDRPVAVPLFSRGLGIVVFVYDADDLSGKKKCKAALLEANALEIRSYVPVLGVNIGFDAALAELIYAGSDMFLLPSKYEPCGLGQLISFRYGTIPVVRKTGGLADTVEDYNPDTGQGTGFVFEEYSVNALERAIEHALRAFEDRLAWEKPQKKVVALDVSMWVRIP